MYDYFKGTLEELTPTLAVVEAGGIGYMLNISLQTYGEISELKEVKLYAHLYAVRDDLPILYGFHSKTEREVFKLLVGVSGVGGNTARTILSTFNARELAQIISGGDIRLLKSVKGLGQKTAEKVIVELRDKIAAVVAQGEEELTGDVPATDYTIVTEAVNALNMLGFNRFAAEKVVRGVVEENPNESIEKIIKLSLKKM